ncbi:hypothetical protein [Micromonospora sp. LH3U1]|uniref:hypothetical protein n=1 Tax=Micromonospora sp. LH3U1 TaxID=3018339 RepID=UPI002349781F|nr:hypothetical protein [Micromonospora sp. LH3U1]WCN81475.1 hypothetical protein PCA76_32285 [Micromonospora sp. LH3U1]
MKAGDLIRLTRAASPQFVQPITVRIIRELTDRHTYHGWTWIEAYELGTDGSARAKRELFVLREGVDLLSSGRPETACPTTRPQGGRVPVRAG